jgi:hypothetical protein
MLSKEVTKSHLRNSQKAVTVTYICRLFTDKSCIKILQKAAQNTHYDLLQVLNNFSLGHNLEHY